MKKFYVLAIALLCSVLNMIAAANHDLIIKTNSEKIEALIQEVSDTELRYKKANNPNGPMFVIKLEEVASIVYANGEVQAIEHKAAPQAQPQQAQPQQGYNYNSAYNPYNGGAYGNYMYGNNPDNGPMQRIGYNEYLIDGHRLKGKELKFFLQQTCPQAHTYYNTWNNCEVAGWCMLGIGAAMFIGIGVGCFVGSYEYSYGTRYSMEAAGIAFWVIGGASMAGSIPLITCGNIFKRRVNQVYNRSCGNNNTAFAPELRLTSGANGLGLALGF